MVRIVALLKNGTIKAFAAVSYKASQVNYKKNKLNVTQQNI
jgi:hypothetical protein